MDGPETTKPTIPYTTTNTAATMSASASANASARADEPPNAPKPRVGLGPGLGPSPSPGAAMSSIPSPFDALPPLAARAGLELPFVQPSSYLRPGTRSQAMPPIVPPMSPVDEEQMQGLVSSSFTSSLSMNEGMPTAGTCAQYS